MDSTTTEKQSSFNSNDLFNNNNTNPKPITFDNTNKHSCQQQVHYQILKCNEIN